MGTSTNGKILTYTEIFNELDKELNERIYPEIFDIMVDLGLKDFEFWRDNANRFYILIDADGDYDLRWKNLTTENPREGGFDSKTIVTYVKYNGFVEHCNKVKNVLIKLIEDRNKAMETLMDLKHIPIIYRRELIIEKQILKKT